MEKFWLEKQPTAIKPQSTTGEMHEPVYLVLDA